MFQSREIPLKTILLYNYYFLNLAIPPVIIVQPQDIDAEINANVTLQCVATAKPPPIYTWTVLRGGVEYPVNGNNIKTDEGNVTFERVGHTDRGLYICHVSNPVGSATSREVIFDIEGKVLP